jgi:hypothetical protein
MCECGCSSCGEFWKLPGLKGTFYIVQKYPGCKGCSAPCGVVIQKITKENHDYDFYNETKDFEFIGDECFRFVTIGFFSHEDLYIKLKKYLIKYFKDRDCSLLEDEDCNLQHLDHIDADTIAEEFSDEFFNEK